jgi:hypothetical protein
VIPAESAGEAKAKPSASLCDVRASESPRKKRASPGQAGSWRAVCGALALRRCVSSLTWRPAVCRASAQTSRGFCPTSADLPLQRASKRGLCQSRPSDRQLDRRALARPSTRYRKTDAGYVDPSARRWALAATELVDLPAAHRATAYYQRGRSPQAYKGSFRLAAKNRGWPSAQLLCCLLLRNEDLVPGRPWEHQTMPLQERPQK